MTSPAQQRLLQAARSSSPMLADRLVAWQRQQGRHHLPWQNTRDPYRVWLSEIMLQQTQVSTVLGYYARFLAAFPDVKALAAASLDDVLTLWAGLGYYSRARNLHRCAQAVVHDHGGSFPHTTQALMTLPGIGRSTAAAIAGFCFHERTAILDGNVKRVLTRVLGWGEDLSVSANERALWLAAETVLPEQAEDMPAYTQGVMDLGATLCTQRKPACLTCPWSDICAARREGRPEAFPVKTRKLKRSSRESWWLWLEHDEQVWLVQRPASGVWGGLWTLPLFDSEALLDQAVTKLGAQAPEIQPAIKHVLTHMDWHLHPRRSLLQTRPPAADLRHVEGEAVGADTAGIGRWVPVSELGSVGLPAPLRKLLPAG
jgi:A/G-specific adenine glycosylase